MLSREEVALLKAYNLAAARFRVHQAEAHLAEGHIARPDDLNLIAEEDDAI
jgi:hypothetical protein